MTGRASVRLSRRDICKGALAATIGYAGCDRVERGIPTTGGSADEPSEPVEPLAIEALPEPHLDGSISVEAAIAARRSQRSYTPAALTREEIGQLLWAAQGITEPSGGRSVPSAGALYPLELYLLTSEGIHHYRPLGHELALLAVDDLRSQIPAQEFVTKAPAIIIITAVFARTRKKYGSNAERFVHLEAGHAAHGILLQAVAQGLGSTPVGAFEKDELTALIGLPHDHEPLYILPVGHPA
jgi:SagB-type dehydrogenase family enzyme